MDDKDVRIGKNAVVIGDGAMFTPLAEPERPLMIWKYTIDIVEETKIEMPEDARIVHAEIQRECFCIWVLCNPDVNMKARTFRIYGTGRPVPPGWLYVGTAIFRNGAEVWHLFIEGE